MEIKKFMIDSNEKIKLQDYSTKETMDLEKDVTLSFSLPKNLEKMAEYQDKLYADGKYGILVVIQAMDTAGKDGIIKHVMTIMNPQGTKVASFKTPSANELAHDYLWRIHLNLPKRGEVSIFNRSHYEDVLISRVHNLLEKQNLPDIMLKENIWENRYQQINNFEKYLYENGIRIIKLFLHISKEEQKERLLARINDPNKNWKFSTADIKERAFWEDYQKVYSEVISNTSTKNAPWYIIPADKKWFARFLVSEIMVQLFEDISPEYPLLEPKDLDNLNIWKEMLLNEKS